MINIRSAQELNKAISGWADNDREIKHRLDAMINSINTLLPKKTNEFSKYCDVIVVCDCCGGEEGSMLNKKIEKMWCSFCLEMKSWTPKYKILHE